MDQQEFGQSFERFLTHPSTAWSHIAFQVIIVLIGCIALFLSGCAHTEITHSNSACGRFASEDRGLGIVVPTAGQYATYRGACAQGEFARVIAEQRSTIVRASWHAAQAHQAPATKADVKEVASGLASHLVGHDDRGAE